MNELKCDFCGVPQITWSYPCREFLMHGILIRGEWAACDICHFMIEAHEDEALVRRSLNTLRAKLPFIPDDVSEIQLTQNLFRQYRTGPPIPYRKDA